MRRILVATDGSDGGTEAVEATAEFASSFGADVVLVHVVEQLGDHGLPTAPVPEKLAAHVEEETRKILTEAGERLDDAGVTHEDVILHGKASTAILGEAESRDIDLVVVGHRGHTAIERFFLGSVADRVAHRAPCAVLVAPQPD